MKYGIICAMDQEIRMILKDMEVASTQEIGGRTFYLGSLYGVDSVVVMSRIGKVAAAATTTILLERFAVDAVVFCGTAGGIDPALRVGDLVVSENCIQHDFDCGTPFRIPIIGIDYFPADARLTALATQAAKEYAEKDLRKEIPAEVLEEFGVEAPAVSTGTIASGDVFLADPEKSRALAAQIRDLRCVEMEGAATAQVCCEFGIPYTVIRVISDGANQDSTVDFEEFIEKAACHFTRGVLRAFMKALAK